MDLTLPGTSTDGLATRSARPPTRLDGPGWVSLPPAGADLTTSDAWAVPADGAAPSIVLAPAHILPGGGPVSTDDLLDGYSQTPRTRHVD
jgi:hypothetical protein